MNREAVFILRFWIFFEIYQLYLHDSLPYHLHIKYWYLTFSLRLLE